MFKTNHLVCVLLAGLLGFVSSCTSEKSKQIVYTITPVVLADTVPRLKVAMTFSTDADGVTKVLFDDTAWGQENLFNCIDNPKVLEEDTKVLVEKDSGWVKITHPKELRQLNFSYQIRQENSGLDARDENYRPVVQPSYFHVFAHNFFMVPQHLGKDGDAMLDLAIHWEGFPEDYTIHNSFGSNERTQQLPAIPLQDFHSAIFVGGDFRVHHRVLKDNHVCLASRGDWVSFNDATVVEILDKTLEVQREFWEDHSQEYFTVTMRPIEQERGSSFQGTGLTNSFATQISNNEYTDIQQLVYLFNHELQHNWIGKAIVNDNEEEQYWFSEGFTEYYTIKNIAKNQIHGLGWDYFMGQINENIRNLYSSPVKEAPNSELTYDTFWSSRDYGKLPYYRGMLFAFYLDEMIQQDSEGKYSLDDVMRDFLKASKETGQKITHPYFIEKVNQYLNGDLTTFFNEHIEKGAWLPLKQLFVDLDLEYEVTCEVFDIGFKLDSEKRSILSVDDSSAAYKAGVRKGDLIGSRSIYYGSTTMPVELTLSRNGTTIPVSYLAVKEVPAPQLKISKKNSSYFKR